MFWDCCTHSFRRGQPYHLLHDCHDVLHDWRDRDIHHLISHSVFDALHNHQLICSVTRKSTVCSATSTISPFTGMTRKATVSSTTRGLAAEAQAARRTNPRSRPRSTAASQDVVRGRTQRVSCRVYNFGKQQVREEANVTHYNSITTYDGPPILVRTIPVNVLIIAKTLRKLGPSKTPDNTSDTPPRSRCNFILAQASVDYPQRFGQEQL